jgi:hypothetical protein
MTMPTPDVSKLGGIAVFVVGLVYALYAPPDESDAVES